MDSAIHKKSGKEYYAWQVWEKGLFESDDVHKEEWLCPKEEIINFEEIIDDVFVTPVRPHTRKDTYIGPFFRLFPGSPDNIKFVNESDEHKMAKTIVCALFTDEFDFRLQYENETYHIKDLPIDYEKIQKNIRKREVVKNNIATGQRKRADVLIPFVFNPYFGNGLVIEIRISEKDENIEDKEDFWFQRGYSIIWMDETDFERVDGRWGVMGNTLQVIPFSVGYNKVLDIRERKMRSYLHYMHETKNDIDELFIKRKDELEESILGDAEALVDKAKGLLNVFEDRAVKTCRTCKHGSCNMKDDDGTIVCWYGTRWGKGNAKGYDGYPSKHEPLDGCVYYERR